MEEEKIKKDGAEIGEKESEKEEFKRYITNTLRSTIGKEITTSSNIRLQKCAHFSCFAEDNDGEIESTPRCLLDEYTDPKTNHPYFTKPEASKICPFFNSRTMRDTKCTFLPNYDPQFAGDGQEYEEWAEAMGKLLLSKLRERGTRDNRRDIERRVIDAQIKKIKEHLGITTVREYEASITEQYGIKRQYLEEVAEFTGSELLKKPLLDFPDSTRIKLNSETAKVYNHGAHEINHTVQRGYLEAVADYSKSNVLREALKGQREVERVMLDQKAMKVYSEFAERMRTNHISANRAQVIPKKTQIIPTIK